MSDAMDVQVTMPSIEPEPVTDSQQQQQQQHPPLSSPQAPSPHLHPQDPQHEQPPLRSAPVSVAEEPPEAAASASDSEPWWSATRTPETQAVSARVQVTLAQRAALRAWAASLPARPHHKACIEWFRNRFGQTISQSTVSHSLSAKYARLDGPAGRLAPPPKRRPRRRRTAAGDEGGGWDGGDGAPNEIVGRGPAPPPMIGADGRLLPQTLQSLPDVVVDMTQAVAQQQQQQQDRQQQLDSSTPLQGTRMRLGNWPDVERLCLLWYRRQKVIHSGRPPSNEELAAKAREIFQRLPRYQHHHQISHVDHDGDAPQQQRQLSLTPNFSHGWVNRFKARYGILGKRYRPKTWIPPPDAGAVLQAWAESGDDPDPGPDAVALLADVVPDLMPPLDAGPPDAPLLGVLPGPNHGPLRQVTAETDSSVIAAAVRAAGGWTPGAVTCAAVRDEIVRRRAQGVLGAQREWRQQQHEQQQQEAQQQEHQEGEASEDDGQEGVEVDEDEDEEAEAGTADLTNGVAYTGHRTTVPAPMRCPFCINLRMLTSTQEAVEHMATHVTL